ncbi:MAG: hemolysin III family protein [Gammaproteobacteria bacterium]|nr:hemolysin III family protein [Gammaproteobacteria bacterium]
MYQGERFNSITHLVGAALALAGAVILIVYASLQGDVWKIVSFSVYGASLFLLYFLSTLYHSLRGHWKVIFQKLDHISIYLLIAGTYTPMTLVALKGTWGWSLFGVVWALAVLGIILDVWHKKGLRIFQMTIYFVMGWLIVIASFPFIEKMPLGGLIWLLAGGLFYSGGIVFYAKDKIIRHAHGIWHLFVLAGSISHYIMIFVYIL